ncbi:MAG: 30S ribosomal protein S9 [Pseudomonadales bacterium]|jgi:small subunit ribosomal protein S9|nr:30S ribosomal protein S9 [Pseudomonadales bacterium]
MAIKKAKKTVVKKVVKKEKVVPVKATSKAVSNVAAATQKGQYVTAVGRRRVSTARVRLYAEAGDFVVNGLAAGKYFASVNNASARYNQPLIVTNTLGKFGISVKVTGGGVSGQIGAVVHGLARALEKQNPDARPLLKEAGLLTRDDRMKETRKIGMGGKARRRRQSPKR